MNRRVRVAWAVAGILGLATPCPGHARDQLFGNPELSETRHEVSLTFERGHATLVVRRTIHNDHAEPDEAQLRLWLPDGAVATGLRTLGEVRGTPRWFAGELLDVEPAEARYRELTGLGDGEPGDPALLAWLGRGVLELRVFPIAPGADKTVEYTLTMPAHWRDGRWEITLYPSSNGSLPTSLTIDPGDRDDRIFVDDQPVDPQHPLSLDHETMIQLVPHDPEPIALSLASVDVGDRHMVRLDVVLAPELSAIPKRARIVVALDLSRSRSPDQLDAQREAALGYLEHFRDPGLAAKVAVIGFDRVIHDLSAGFVDVDQAIAQLNAADLMARNGSEIGEALEHAIALLTEHAPSGAPRRIVLLTDFATATRLTPAALAPVVDRSGAIVHLASVEPGWPSLVRVDDHAWSSLAARTEGVVWAASVGDSGWDDPDDDEQPHDMFEEWARPLRIDGLDLDVEGLRFADAETFDLDLLMPETLTEGEGIELIDLSLFPALELTLTGRTWNRPIVQSVRPSPAHGDLWSALALGSDLLGSLDDAETRVLAMRGHAVSPVTSYLAIEPDMRPSGEGLDFWRVPPPRSWGYSNSWGGTGLIGLGGGGGRQWHVDQSGWLSDRLVEVWRHCGATERSPGTVTLETTFAELVDVGVALEQPDGALESCLRHAIWTFELPEEFDRAHATWSFDL